LEDKEAVLDLEEKKADSEDKDDKKKEEPRQGVDFYRTDFRRFDVINEGSLYHFNGFSHFSSLAPGGISKLMEHLGIAAAGNSYRYYDTTPLVDAITSMRYVMNKGQEFPLSDTAYKYTSEKLTGSIWLAENTRVLPLGFMTDPEVLNWQTEDSQPFEVQNDFVHRAAGLTEDLFTMVPPKAVTVENISVEDVSEHGDVFNYKASDPYDLTAPPSVHAEFRSDRNQYLWLYVDAPNASRLVFEKKGVIEDRELSAGRSMINVGHVSEGEKIEVHFSLTRRGAFEKTWRKEGSVRLFAAGWNDAVFEKAYNSLNTDTLQLRRFEDTRIEGTIEASEDGILLTSIPYTSGWKVCVDGTPVEKRGIGENGLLGFEVTAGPHEVVLEYSSPFAVPAAVSSVTGVVLFLFLRRYLQRMVTRSPISRNHPEEHPHTHVLFHL
ncbi:MAG: YfhO family protein, partial [Eubacteriales bacterium]|nr:YfhO family protein [Eubacteriales bacterium]